MAKYLLLIFGDEKQWDAMTPDERTAHNAAHKVFSDAAGARIVGGAELELASMATTVRLGESDELVTTDGPFLEAKEAVGGYYLLDADDLDAALEVAARIPAARMGGAIEVRPVVEHER